MSGAPPTPPPTEPAAQPAPSVYAAALPDLLAPVQAGAIDRFVALAEDLDLTGPESDPARLLVTVPLVLGYLGRDDVPPARFALTRLPEPCTATPLAKHAFDLVASTSQRTYPNVYARAQVLREFVAAGCGFGPADQDFTQIVSLLLDHFLDGFRKRAFQLVSKSYTSIPLALAQVYLGLPEEKLIAETTREGWQFADGLFTPKRVADPSTSQTFAARPSSINSFDQVVRAAAQLESFAS